MTIKVFTLTCLVATTAMVAFGQSTTEASLGTVNRPTPKFGFNTNGHMPANVPNGTYAGANWTQQDFIDSTVWLYPEVLRYPGGTNANHWDWQTGWFVAGYQPPGSSLTVRADEFKPGIQGCDGEALFVVNLETSDAAYEMQGLRHADTIGLDPHLIELGNEHNLNGGAQYPDQLMTPLEYATLAKTYYDSVIAEFPDAMICAVGGNTPNIAGWNDTVLKYVPDIDALAFHVYLTANNADLVFNVNRALAIPFGDPSSSNTLVYRYNLAGFGSLDTTKQVWVTEFNLQENQIASSLVISQTWTHLLYVTAMNHFFLSHKNVGMVLNHSLASSATYFEAVSRKDHHITANALAMKLLYDVSRGADSCQVMDFSGDPYMLYNSDTIPKLIGWQFRDTLEDRGFLCNFSPDTFKVSLAGVFEDDMDFDMYYADTALAVSGIASLNKYSGSSEDTITVYPFSITQIVATEETSSLAVTHSFTEDTFRKNEVWMYPNPATAALTIQTGFDLSDADVYIYNLSGQEVMQMHAVSSKKFVVPTDQLPKGGYVVKVFAGKGIISSKFIVD